jgi:hypothetical protein
MDKTIDIETFTNKIASIIRDHDFERIELSLKEPNIFKALSIQRRELSHSNFLSYILDPNETHGLKDLILRRFIRDIFLNSKTKGKTIVDADYVDYNDVEIRREWRNIDIIILLKKDVIVIENKVDTEDHSDQLKRYKKIAEETFNGKKIYYVYLTPTGNNPRDDESREHYINYSYSELLGIVESILNLYKNNLGQKVNIYLADYVTIVKRELLMNDEINLLAKKVYNAHKDAFELIFNYRPDPSRKLYEYFKNILENEDFVIRSESKGYIRFTTKELDKILPKNGSDLPEAFLFEIDYSSYDKKLSVRAYISPGEENTRNKLLNAVKSVNKYYKNPTGKKWLNIYSFDEEFNSSEIINEDADFINDKISSVINKIKPAVIDFSNAIVKEFEKGTE